MKKEKTVMLISQSLAGGGAEKVAANLSLELIKKCNVIFVTYEQTENEYQFGGLRVNIHCPGGESNLLVKIVTALNRIKKISQLKKKYKVDCSISFVPQTDYANVCSKVKGCKNFIEVSSNSSMAFQSGILREVRKILLKAADRVIVVSEGSREDVVENFGVNREKTAVIYNTCDIAAIHESLTQESHICDRKYIVTVGSFRYPKGHWHLIKAFSEIADQIPDYDLVILGDGQYREKYNELIHNLGIDKSRIKMPGYIPNPYSAIKNSSLFVFSSIFEGFGNVIIEAMACGVPVLSVDCDFGPKEILEPSMNVKDPITTFYKAEYGWLLPAFSKEDIDMTNAINTEEKRLGSAILDCLRDTQQMEIYRAKGLTRCLDFSTSRIVDQWIEVLDTKE